MSVAGFGLLPIRPSPPHRTAHESRADRRARCESSRASRGECARDEGASSACAQSCESP